MHNMNIDLTTYFRQQANHQGYITESVFIDLLSERLQLCPEFCTASHINNFWAILDKTRLGKLQVSDIVNYI